MFTDNADFYPTPRPLARRMLAKITNKEAKYFLEPSAGKGDIADVICHPRTYEEFCEENPDYEENRRTDRGWRSWDDSNDRRRVNVDVIESYPALVDVLRGKEYEVVGFDWLSYEGVSYYDAVVMNPPFSAGAAHLLKAWDFLHNGEIVCLLNEETIKNPYTEDRQRLARLIETFGSVEYLGDCFSTAERKTSVNVAMVYLKKVAADDTQDLWADKTTQEKHYGAEFDGDVQMLAIRDNLANMEHWYNMANEHWMKGIEHIRKAKFLMDQNKISEYSGRQNGGDDTKTILAMALENVQTCRAEFLRSHRRRAWTSVFEQMEFNRWLDSKQQESFMRDVQRDSTIPFTAQNIRATLDNVFQSRKKLFEESVARVFDELCSHAVENGEGPVIPETLKSNWRQGEGWKTNDNYKVNKKLIFPYGISFNYGHFSVYSGRSGTIYTDIDRILCVLDGKSFKDCYTVGESLHRTANNAKTGGTFESEYFEGRFYKKGTVHLKWKRDDLWERFNLTAAAGKKWLGEDTQQYRPNKRKDGNDADNWRCRTNHSFLDGICEHCKSPEIDEVEAVECEYCRAIFEHTGRKYCMMHEEAINLPDSFNTTLTLPVQA